MELCRISHTSFYSFNDGIIIAVLIQVLEKGGFLAFSPCAPRKSATTQISWDFSCKRLWRRIKAIIEGVEGIELRERDFLMVRTHKGISAPAKGVLRFLEEETK